MKQEACQGVIMEKAGEIQAWGGRFPPARTRGITGVTAGGQQKLRNTGKKKPWYTGPAMVGKADERTRG